MKKKYLKNKSYKKKYKFSRKFNKSICLLKRIFKIIIIFIMSFVYYYFYSTQNNNKKIQMNNNNWIKKNITKFINNYFFLFKNNNDTAVLLDHKYVEEYLSLKVIIKEGNLTLNLETKEELKKEIERRANKNFSYIKNLFIEDINNFGNRIIAFNNIIYYSEILGIKNIFLNSRYNWYIKNDINTDKIHISVISRDLINCNSIDTFCFLIKFLSYPIIIKSERRSLILKEEIKRNLPKIIINKNDLYIYIRSGDSFNIRGNGYPQTPYCFYQKVISQFKFDNIYLIAQDNKSPVTQKLLNDYPKIKYSLNSLEIDLATLMNAYNLVNAFSSFSLAAITYNDNLINLFEYEQIHLRMYIVHFHYYIDKLERKFNIYKMKPDKDFYVNMFVWRNTHEQRKSLFEDNCKNEFKRIDSDKTIFD